MKKILLLIGGMVLVLFLSQVIKQPELFHNQETSQRDVSTNISSPTPKPTLTPLKKSLFVAHWNIEPNHWQLYDRLIFFTDTNYSQLNAFVAASGSQEKYLAIKYSNNMTLTDSELDTLVKVIRDNDFAGFVIDLEPKIVLFDSQQEQIDTLISGIANVLKPLGKKTAVAVYGDNYYRKRGIDAAAIAGVADEVMIMAYDFHKSAGEPGPNFPFMGKDKYGYDFRTMIENYLSQVPAEKLTVVFGMYGYDWEVDEHKKPIKPASALTLNQIQAKFLDKCEWQQCVVQRDDVSGETEVNYVISEVKDNFGYMYYHIVWFEDAQSVNLKTDYLQTQGINSTVFWANGYY